MGLEEVKTLKYVNCQHCYGVGEFEHHAFFDMLHANGVEIQEADPNEQY